MIGHFNTRQQSKHPRYIWNLILNILGASFNDNGLAYVCHILYFTTSQSGTSGRKSLACRVWFGGLL